VKPKKEKLGIKRSFSKLTLDQIVAYLKAWDSTIEKIHDYLLRFAYSLTGGLRPEMLKEG